MADIGLFEAIHSQRSFTRYKTDPVPHEAIEKILDAATKAPSGGNVQPWQFVAVTDRDLVRRLGELYRDDWLNSRGHTAPTDEPPAYRSARYLANHMPDVPAMILICADHLDGYLPYTPGQPLNREQYGSSVWLAAQNIFLAARALGLGTRLTTVLHRKEAEVRALLGIPEHIEVMAMTPLGYPRGSFGPPVRQPASDFISWDRWGNRA